MSPEISDEERFRRAIDDSALDALTYGFSAYKIMLTPSTWRAGVLFRWGSCWVGTHWSSTNKRLCVNLLPFVTVWVCPPGGIAP